MRALFYEKNYFLPKSALKQVPGRGRTSHVFRHFLPWIPEGAPGAPKSATGSDADRLPGPGKRLPSPGRCFFTPISQVANLSFCRFRKHPVTKGAGGSGRSPLNKITL